jgi:hypothetical protein
MGIESTHATVTEIDCAPLCLPFPPQLRVLSALVLELVPKDSGHASDVLTAHAVITYPVKWIQKMSFILSDKLYAFKTLILGAGDIAQ